MRKPYDPSAAQAVPSGSFSLSLEEDQPNTTTRQQRGGEKGSKEEKKASPELQRTQTLRVVSSSKLHRNTSRLDQVMGEMRDLRAKIALLDGEVELGEAEFKELERCQFDPAAVDKAISAGRRRAMDDFAPTEHHHLSDPRKGRGGTRGHTLLDALPLPSEDEALLIEANNNDRGWRVGDDDDDAQDDEEERIEAASMPDSEDNQQHPQFEQRHEIEEEEMLSTMQQQQQQHRHHHQPIDREYAPSSDQRGTTYAPSFFHHHHDEDDAISPHPTQRGGVVGYDPSSSRRPPQFEEDEATLPRPYTDNQRKRRERRRDDYPPKPSVRNAFSAERSSDHDGDMTTAHGRSASSSVVRPHNGQSVVERLQYVDWVLSRVEPTHGLKPHDYGSIAEQRNDTMERAIARKVQSLTKQQQTASRARNE